MAGMFDQEIQGITLWWEEDARFLPMDALIDEEHGHTAEASAHAIEGGGDVADHVQPKDFILSFTALLTLTPRDDGGGDFPRRHFQLFDALVALMRAGTVFRVETAMGSYDRMVITAVSASRGPGTGHSLRPKVSMKQIRFAESRVVRVAVPARMAPRVKAGAGAEADKGEVAAKPADGTYTSALRNAADWWSGGGSTP